MPEKFSESNKNQFDDIKKEQWKILIDQGNISFDRSLSTIESINSKILSLFEIYLVMVTLHITILLFLSEKRLSWILIGLIVLMVITILLFYKFSKPKTYEYFEIFGENELKKWLTYNNVDLLKDFFYNTQKSYQQNEKVLEELSTGLKLLYILVIVTFVYFIIALMSGYIIT